MINRDLSPKCQIFSLPSRPFLNIIIYSESKLSWGSNQLHFTKGETRAGRGHDTLPKMEELINGRPPKHYLPVSRCSLEQPQVWLSIDKKCNHWVFENPSSGARFFSQQKLVLDSPCCVHGHSAKTPNQPQDLLHLTSS